MSSSAFPVFTSRDEGKQRVCLDIIHKITALLTPVQLQELLGSVTAFTSHPSPVCRERMYDILMWIQDNYRCQAAVQHLRTSRRHVAVIVFVFTSVVLSAMTRA